MNNRGLLIVTALLCSLSGIVVDPGPARADDPPPEGAAVGYAVPVEAPTGEVQILSLGIADLPRPSGIGTDRFVHMRLAAHNQKDGLPWVLDSRDQLIELPGGVTLPPRFAESSNPASAAHVVLTLAQRGYLDLFFQVEDDFDPAWTSLVWKLRRGTGMIVARTVFERLPDTDALYAHYWPSQYFGGTLLYGAVWCMPAWDWPWADSLRPWSHYRRYRYHRHDGGFAVSDGHTRWHYHRGRPRGASDSVSDRWRAPADRPPVIARPAPAEPAPRPSPSDRARWHWQVERTLEVPADSGSAIAASPSSSSGRSPSPPRPSSTESSPSPSVERFRESHSRFSSSSFSSPPPAPSPPPPAPSPPPRESSSSSAPSSPPASEPSHSPSGSVGSRWRSR